MTVPGPGPVYGFQRAIFDIADQEAMAFEIEMRAGDLVSLLPNMRDSLIVGGPQIFQLVLFFAVDFAAPNLARFFQVTITNIIAAGEMRFQPNDGRLAHHRRSLALPTGQMFSVYEVEAPRVDN